MKRARKRSAGNNKTTKQTSKTADTREQQYTEDYSSIIDEIRSEQEHKPTEEKNVASEPAPTRSKKKEKKKKKQNPKKTLLIILAILAVLLCVAMGLDLFDDNDILQPLNDGQINVLMMGVDEEGLRTDAIMVASYDVNEGKVNLLSIPRDTKVYVQNKKCTRKINEIHAMSGKGGNGKIMGAFATAEAVEQLTGIPINYYVEFSFLSIDHLFDQLGEVTYDVPDVEGKGRGMNYDDPVQNLHIHLKPGEQKLTGNQVQQFLRYRKSNYGVGSGSDTDRVQRQQDFVKAVIDQKLNASLLIKLPGIYSQLSKEIKTNISAGDITKYIRYLGKVTGENINTYSLPGDTKTVGGGSYFVCDLEGTKELVSEVFKVNAEISDKITLTEIDGYKPLRAGNLQKKDAAKENEEKTPEAKSGEASSDKTSSEKGEKSEDKAVKSEKKEDKVDEKEGKQSTGAEEKKPEEPKKPAEPDPIPDADVDSLEEIYNID